MGERHPSPLPKSSISRIHPSVSIKGHAGVRRDGRVDTVRPGPTGRVPAPVPRIPQSPGRSRFPARVAMPRAPVSISRRDSANLRPTSDRAAGPPSRQARAPEPLARRAPHPTSPQRSAQLGPAWSGVPLTAAGSAPHLLSSSWEAEAAAAAMLRPGASERASEGGRGGGRGGRTAGEGGSRPSPCRVGPRRAAGARGRLGSLTQAARRPRGPPAACVLRAASVALAAPRELATRELPRPRASEKEPPPPVRPRDRAAALSARRPACSPASRRLFD